MYTPYHAYEITPDDRPISLLDGVLHELPWLSRTAAMSWKSDSKLATLSWPRIPTEADGTHDEEEEDSTPISLLDSRLAKYASEIGIKQADNSTQWYTFGRKLSHVEQLDISQLLQRDLAQLDYTQSAHLLNDGYKIIRLIEIIRKLRARVSLAVLCTTTLYPLVRDRVADSSFITQFSKPLSEFPKYCSIRIDCDISGHIDTTPLLKWSSLLSDTAKTLRQFPDITAADIHRRYRIHDASVHELPHQPGTLRERLGQKIILLRALAIIADSDPLGITPTELGHRVWALENKKCSNSDAQRRGAGYKHKLVKEIGIPIKEKQYSIEWNKLEPRLTEELRDILRDVPTTCPD